MENNNAEVIPPTKSSSGFVEAKTGLTYEQNCRQSKPTSNALTPSKKFIGDLVLPVEPVLVIPTHFLALLYAFWFPMVGTGRHHCW